MKQLFPVPKLVFCQLKVFIKIHHNVFGNPAETQNNKQRKLNLVGKDKNNHKNQKYRINIVSTKI